MTGMRLTLICPPIRTSGYPDENPIGYLIRLAKQNSYTTYRWLLDGNGIETVDYEKLYQTFIGADWTGFKNAEQRELAQICALPNIHLNSTRLRYCPLCLQEANYWRIGWQLKLSAVCVRHRVWLQDLCPQCQKPYSFVSTGKKGCQCLEYLTAAELEPAVESVVELQRFLEQGIEQNHFELFDATQSLPLRRRSEWLVFLMSWLTLEEDADKPSRQSFQHLADIRSRAERSADALCLGQEGFWRYLQTIHLAGASSLGIQQKRLVCFYRQCFKEFPEPAFHRLREIVEHYATMNLIRDITEKHTLFGPNAKKTQHWYSFSKACKAYDLAPSELNRAIVDKHVRAHYDRTNEKYTKCAIYRPDLEKILPHLNELVTARDAMEILGVTKAQFVQLQNNGSFKFEATPREGYCSTWKYSKFELETLMETINRSAAPPSEDCILLSQILQNRIHGTIEMPFLHVYKGIVSGQLIVRKLDDKPRKLREFWLDKREFCYWLSQLQPKTDSITITEAAKVLGINEEFAYQLVNRGYLQHKLDSRNAKMIFPDHVNRFRQEFVILSTLSEKSKYSSSRIIEILDGDDIYPVDHNQPEKLRQRLYARADVLLSNKFYRYVQYLTETNQ